MGGVGVPSSNNPGCASPLPTPEKAYTPTQFAADTAVLLIQPTAKDKNARRRWGQGLTTHGMACHKDPQHHPRQGGGTVDRHRRVTRVKGAEGLATHPQRRRCARAGRAPAPPGYAIDPHLAYLSLSPAEPPPAPDERLPPALPCRSKHRSSITGDGDKTRQMGVRNKAHNHRCSARQAPSRPSERTRPNNYPPPCFFSMFNTADANPPGCPIVT